MPRGVVGHGDGEAIPVTELCLEAGVPDVAGRAIATATIRKDQEAATGRVAFAPFGLPPGSHAICHEGGRLAAGANDHQAAVRFGVVETVGDSNARGVRPKIGGQGLYPVLLPRRACVSEIPHQLFLLAVDADDRVTGPSKSVSASADHAKLLVPILGRRRRPLLVIDAQAKIHLCEQATDRAAPHGNALLS